MLGNMQDMLTTPSPNTHDTHDTHSLSGPGRSGGHPASGQQRLRRQAEVRGSEPTDPMPPLAKENAP